MKKNFKTDIYHYLLLNNQKFMSCRNDAGRCRLVPVPVLVTVTVLVPVLITVTVLIPAPGVVNSADRCRDRWKIARNAVFLKNS
jgi:hypothetical protein